MPEPAFPCHERLTLQNFTAFSDETFHFAPGINVLIGENGAGKTHVMKALYAWQMARHLKANLNNAPYAAEFFASTYGVQSARELQRIKSKSAFAAGKFGKDEWYVGFQEDSSYQRPTESKSLRPVFIPAIEMMAHARNMNGILRDYADFDRTCFDFLAMVTAEPLTERKPNSFETVSSLKPLIPGEVEWNEAEQRFYLVEKGKRLPFALVAEGLRKVSALYRLAQNGWLPPGGTLFWDEPEVNLNPKWMDEVVEALVALARSGVQIFLATHSYVILKEIDLALREQQARKEEAVSARFFSLRRERGVSRAMQSDDFAALEPNPILDHYDQMLARDWQLQSRANGGGKTGGLK